MIPRDGRLFRKIQFDSCFILRIKRCQKHFNEWNIFFLANAITRVYVEFRCDRHAACTIKFIYACCYKFNYFVNSLFILHSSFCFRLTLREILRNEKRKTNQKFVTCARALLSNVNIMCLQDLYVYVCVCLHI